MVSSQWRMNELWRTAGVLLLFTLLLSSDVICQDDATDAPSDVTTAAADAVDDPAATVATGDASAAPEAGDAPAGDSSSPAPGDAYFPATIINMDLGGDAKFVTFNPLTGDSAEVVIDDGGSGKNVASDGDNSSSSSSSGSSVFVGLLVTGLLAALAITIGYFKCQRRPEKTAVKLAEEAYPVDQENQGNTLVSVAPLNPPPETPEKPSANGDSTEPPKTPPPTNGHSTAKAADTEL